MAHFICKGGCGAGSELESVCETDGCSKQWELLEECKCEDGQHFRGEADTSTDELVITKDSNGTVLQDGDDVVLIKDLTLRGTSKTFKRGTKAKIKLTDSPEEVDCRLEGTAIVLRTEFLKKV